MKKPLLLYKNMLKYGMFSNKLQNYSEKQKERKKI